MSIHLNESYISKLTLLELIKLTKNKNYVWKYVVPVKHVSKEQFFYNYNFNLEQESWSSRRSVSGLSFSVMAELRILVKFILLYTRKFNNLKIYLRHISSHWSSHYFTIVLFSTIHQFDHFTIYIYIYKPSMRWEYWRRWHV